MTLRLYGSIYTALIWLSTQSAHSGTVWNTKRSTP
jgi:hypothetical protein